MVKKSKKSLKNKSISKKSQKLKNKRNKLWYEYNEIIKNKNKKSLNKYFVTNDLFDFVPKISKSNSMTKFNFPDITIGSVHYDEGPVGCTYIDFKNGARVHQDLRGGYVANTTMSSINIDYNVTGICLAGGYTLGLEAIGGCSAEKMKESDYYYEPITNGAIISSNKFMTPGNMVYADKKLGRFAVKNRKANFVYNGQVGCGTMARNGQGVAFKEDKGIKYLVLVINNALGDIYDEKNKCIKKTFSNHKKEYKISNKTKNRSRNTTLTVLITNLDLKIELLESMANQVHSSMGKNIIPFNTVEDGDILYACSTREIKFPFNSHEFVSVCKEMGKLAEKAVIKSVV